MTCLNDKQLLNLILFGATGGILFYEFVLVSSLNGIVDFFLDRVNWKWRMRR